MWLWQLLLVTIYQTSAQALRCYSCASAEYQTLLERNTKFGRTARTPPLDRFCDNEDSIRAIAPMEPCVTTCITVYEPNYVGGLQSVAKPFHFIRGCADRIFEPMSIRPREIDFLHQAPICVSLPMSAIYPHVEANEDVKVCSCTETGCNYRTSDVNGALRECLRLLMALLIVFYFY